VDPRSGSPAIAALITHLHRDHADAGALEGSLAPDAPVRIPEAYPDGGPPVEAGSAQARQELATADLQVVETPTWERFDVGPFTVSALPAADGTGEPQISWAIESEGVRVLHCGDSMFHGWWWRMARFAGPFDAVFVPINGAVVNFPWRQPPSSLPAVMTAEESVLAARLLGAGAVVPMHYGGFDLEPFYRSASDALPRFVAAAERGNVNAVELELGGVLDLAPTAKRAGVAPGR
jgi:L-ascorbate metabolism protein UlaG (beta-lactamase superfamily)